MKDASNAQVMNLMKELEKEQKKHKELQAALTEKSKAVTKAEAQCRSLENEKLLFETEEKVTFLHSHQSLCLSTSGRSKSVFVFSLCQVLSVLIIQ